MTPAQLKAIRLDLKLSGEWCAEMVGGVAPRSWWYWESGGRTVPDDVAARMQALSVAIPKALQASARPPSPV